MQNSDVENAGKVVEALYELVQEEGSSVEIVYPNPDFEGPESTIKVQHNFLEHTQYWGETTLECLEQALVDYRKGRSLYTCIPI